MRLLTSTSPVLSSVRRIPHRLLLGSLLILTVLLSGASGSLALPISAPSGLPQAESYCENLDYLLINPSFETRSGWTLLGAEAPPQYTTERAYHGNWSMRLGIVGTNNVPSISAVQVTMDIPTFAASPSTDLILSMRYWSIVANDAGRGGGNDLQYVEVYNAYNNQLIKRLWSASTPVTILDMNGDGRADEVDAASQEWPFQSMNLNDVKGVTDRIRLVFAVTNDGGDGTTALYLDDLQLRACDNQSPTGTPTAIPSPTATTSPSPTASGTATATPSITPTPVNQTPSPTPSPAPPPQGCVESSNIIRNGSFENDSDWFFGQDPYPPSYDTGEHFSGARSVRLGVPSSANTVNVPTYSSVRQKITIPSSATGARLLFHVKRHTDQAPDDHPGNTSDRLDVIILNEDLSTHRILERILRDDSTWVPYEIEFSLASPNDPFYIYTGRPFVVYFNVYNDGNGARTWAYLDDVKLCYDPAPVPTMTPVPSATSTAPSTATMTPTPEMATATTTPTDLPTAEATTYIAALDGTPTLDATLLAQAYALATQAAGTPTFDPNQQVVGQEDVGGNRPVTPEGQTPVPMIPVPGGGGLSIGNRIGIFVFVLFLIVAAAVVFARRQTPRHP